ncbi:hypothetical protein [Williamsia sp.]|uniref:hypothetical protein n=1 Tax=Williamsia sp. TaxID=1872085 RepID=UPI002F9245B7
MIEPGALSRRSIALLGVAALTAVTVSMTWVRAEGSPVPSTADISRAEVDRAGASETIHASGLSTTAGVVLLTLACALSALALWCVSPSYRPAWAGYLTITLSAMGIATVLWFTGDEQHSLAALAGSADINSDSVQLSSWPWATLCCLATACVLGILLVPHAEHSEDLRPRTSTGRAA